VETNSKFLSWSRPQVVDVKLGQLRAFCVTSGHVFLSTVHAGRGGSGSGYYDPCIIGTSQGLDATTPVFGHDPQSTLTVDKSS
jgi:hypothetical protein